MAMSTNEINAMLAGYNFSSMSDTNIRCPMVLASGVTCMSTMKSFNTITAVCNAGHSMGPHYFIGKLSQTVSQNTTIKILKDAYNLTDVTGTTTSQLKCLKCGKRAYSNRMQIICTGNATHNIENREYITRMADMYEGLTRANENTPTLSDKPIL